MQIMPGQKHWPQHFLRSEQMVDIGARIALTGRTAAFFINWARITKMPCITNINRSAPCKTLPCTARARRHDAIEHVDTALYSTHNIIGLTNPHQITWLIVRQMRHSHIQHAEHFLLPFADRKAAYGITIEADFL